MTDHRHDDAASTGSLTFTPIVDLIGATAVAYVVSSADVSAGGPLDTGPLDETAVRRVSRAIGALDVVGRSARFFVTAPRAAHSGSATALDALEAALLRGGRIDRARFVVCLGELRSAAVAPRARSEDPPPAASTVRALAERGFEVCVTGLGGAGASLAVLAQAIPSYAWLDAALVRAVGSNLAALHVVRALSDVARALDVRLVAPDVDSADVVEALVDAGVRLATGPLFGDAAPEPAPPSSRAIDTLSRRLGGSRAVGTHAPDVGVQPLVRAAVTVDPDTSVESLEALFREKAHVDHVVLATDGHPVGLVTRLEFHRRTAGPFGYSLHQRKSVRAIAKSSPLVVVEDTPIPALAARAMARAPDDLYDPVLVASAEGELRGTLTMKQLLERSIELQIETAQGASPLTGLPGNVAIERWIATLFARSDAHVVYADLDRFKEFNDRYGFLVGDEMLRLAARVLVRHLGESDPPGLVGHVGGDDFVLVFPEGVAPSALDACCAAFDMAKLALFTDEDARRGWFEGKDRRGERTETPLVTLSLAVIERSRLGEVMHPALLSQIAAQLKAEVKQRNAQTGRSGHLEERRDHTSTHGPDPGA